VSLHHKAQNVYSVLTLCVSMLLTHQDKSRLNRTFWNSSNKLVTFDVSKPHPATKHFEFHSLNGFVRLTLQNRERRFTWTTGNSTRMYSWSIDWLFTAQRAARRLCRRFLEKFIHGAQLLKTLPALLHPQNSASLIQSTLLWPFTLRYITISPTPLYPSIITTCLFNSNLQIKNQHACHFPYARYMFWPFHYLRTTTMYIR
jgi:hypothetical protein